MIEFILGMFTSDQKVEAILSNPLIEIIFMVLFITFIITFFIHLALFNKLKKIRNYLKDTNRMDIEPLHAFKAQFDDRQQSESVKPETFVQEKFSGWRVFNIPVVSLIKMVQMTVSIFILIGVLGTFIGLTMSLGGIDADGNQLVENIAGVLAGIDVAFYTSIAGMGLSLIMTVLIKLLNTEYMLTDIMLKVESNLEGNEQGGISRLIEVSETINQSIQGLQETNQESLNEIVHAFAGFQEYTTGLQQSAEDLATFNEGLSDNLQQFQALFQSMKVVTDGFSNGTKKLNKNFDALFSYFKKMDGRNERMTKTFENTYERVKEVSTAQIESLNQFDDSVGAIKDFINSTMDEQKDIQSGFQNVMQQSSDLVETMKHHNKEFKQIFGDDLSAQLTGIISYLGELSKDFDKLGHSIGGLPHALEVINQTQAEYKHLLSDRFEELKEFNRSFSNHLKAHSSESAAFEKQMYDASTTYEQVGVKNNQLIQEINATISQMNHAFNRRENQMEASVGILKDTLSSYVAGLEGTLGDKLDLVIRNISDSVERTHASIKTEFAELRRLSEQVQQSHARNMQGVMRDLSQEIQTLNRQLNTGSQEKTIGLNQNEY